MNKEPVTLTVFSDLHREFSTNSNDGRHRWFWNNPAYKIPNADGANLCVLAGDIIAGNNSTDFFDTFCDRFEDVIMVAGNHEAYQAYYEDVQERLRAYDAKRSNFHYLERDTVTIRKQRFVGCTMWYKGDLTRSESMNDFRRIKMRNSRFGSWVFEYAAHSVQWLYDTTQSDDVVITHMLPCSSAVDQEWRGHPLNCYYYNDGDQVIEDKRPKLWIHGHSHSSLDIMLGNTRILRNPRGYPNEMNARWQPNLRITL